VLVVYEIYIWKKMKSWKGFWNSSHFFAAILIGNIFFIQDPKDQERFQHSQSPIFGLSPDSDAQK